MKLALESNLFLYVVIRVLLSGATVGAVIVGFSLLIADTALMIMLSIPLAVAICSHTAVIIVRRVNYLIAAPLSRILESADMLATASKSVIKTAECMYRNTHIMNDVACLLGEVADGVCSNGATPEDEN